MLGRITPAGWILLCALAFFAGRGCDGLPNVLPDLIPNPAPISEPGLRVLILHQTEDLLPPAQHSILTSTEIRGYLNARSPKGPDGKTPEYRVWDADYTADHLRTAPQWARDAYEQARAAPGFRVPWIVVSNGRTGYSGPLPPNIPETLTLLRKYGE